MRWVGVAAFVLLIAGPLLAFRQRAPELTRFVADPASVPKGAISGLKAALRLDSVYAVTYGLLVGGICLIGTRKAARYRGVGRWMAGFVIAGALSDLAENRLALHALEETSGAAGALPYLSAVKVPLFIVPVLFACGVVVAWARDGWGRKSVDVRAVREAIEWAQGAQSQAERPSPYVPQPSLYTPEWRSKPKTGTEAPVGQPDRQEES